MSKFSQRNYPAPQAKSAVTMPLTDAPNPSYLVSKSEPAPAPGVKVLPDRVEFTLPKIKLVEYIFVGNVQMNELAPKRAYVAHGVLVIEEFGLALHGASFRVTF